MLQILMVWCVMVSQMTFPLRLAEIALEVETHLAALLAKEPEGGEIEWPDRLLDAMRHAVLAGGKRLRPFLTVETARLLSHGEACGDSAAPFRVGAAIELVHCYSLVHDDLPSMDDDDLRRGRPTVHKAYDEATAILAGDALQCLAFATLADQKTSPDPAARADLVLGLAKASGIGGMVGGQMLDLAHEGRYGEADPDIPEILRMQAMKTGALLSFAVEAGAILVQAEDAARVTMRAYGQAVGAAFQIADDLLDLESTAAEMGKRTGKDAERGKATLVDRLGVSEARAECDRLLGKALAALSGFGDEADILRDAARFVITRRS